MNTTRKAIALLCALSLCSTSAMALNTINKFETKSSYDIVVKEPLLEEPSDKYYIKLSAFKLDDLLRCETGWDILNVLYPSGLRIPTCCVTMFDNLMDDKQVSIVRDDVASLLVQLSNASGVERYDFTSAEYAAVSAYYQMLYLKSIALDLPPFYASIQGYVNEEVSIDEAKNLVEEFENTYGAILFPRGEWMDSVESKYGVDMSVMALEGNQSSFCIPTSKVIVQTAEYAYSDLHIYYSDSYQNGGESYDVTKVTKYGLSSCDNFILTASDTSVLSKVYAEYLNSLDLSDWGLVILRAQNPVDIKEVSNSISNSIEEFKIAEAEPDVEEEVKEETTTGETSSGFIEPEVNSEFNPTEGNYFSQVRTEQTPITVDSNTSVATEQKVTQVNRRISARYVYSILCLLFVVISVIVLMIRDWIRKRKDPLYRFTRRL